ncbi:MAG TPA: hypothetical protein PKB10_13400, partial [Tepidisphaeraceae bacterium]|nr:hypothetical protein [Tepidisphaeraceae bacterium]
MDRHRASDGLLRLVLPTVALLSLVIAGCGRGPTLLPPDQRGVIDRQIIEYPSGFVLTPYVEALTAPVAMAFIESDDELDGTLLVAESGIGGAGSCALRGKTDRGKGGGGGGAGGAPLPGRRTLLHAPPRGRR